NPGALQYPPRGYRQGAGHRRGRQLGVLVGQDLHRYGRFRPGGEQGAQEAVQVEVALARCAAVAGALVEVVIGDREPGPVIDLDDDDLLRRQAAQGRQWPPAASLVPYVEVETSVGPPGTGHDRGGGGEVRDRAA